MTREILKQKKYVLAQEVAATYHRINNLLTFKQYRKLPSSCNEGPWLQALRRVTKSKKILKLAASIPVKLQEMRELRVQIEDMEI